ncbi:hypothetical protein ACIRPK_26915 [Kitasatospora sp. NPDC101801]|uniref:hypothetical protein n=1 Tax=Kitasatospora sp. NPDC101801 TaxID=3364103 RepID=UPI0037F8A746
MSSAELPLHDLVESTVEDIVATAKPDAGHWLIGELEQRGPEAMWAGALQLIRPLAARPAYGLPEHEAAAQLRANARAANPATALVLEIRLALSERVEEEARELWNKADPALRRTAVMDWLISYAWVFGFRGAKLTAQQAVSLIRCAIQRQQP